VIRTIIILFEIFVDDTNGHAFNDLEKILDIVTPLYKHRMDKLAPQQQEIIDYIALKWDAVNVKEIAEKTKLPSKAVSSQLKRLEKYYIIEKVQTNNKNLMYRISERFFNIWYLMRLGRKWDERRVRFFVEFLQNWCDDKELEIRANKHLKAIKSGEVDASYAIFMTEALARTSISMEIQHQLILETRDYLKKTNSELISYLTRSDIELTNDIKSALELNDPEALIKNLEKIKSKSPVDYNLLGMLYFKINKQLSKEYLLKAIDKNYVVAIHNLALLYESEFKEYKKAVKYYLMAIKKDDVDAINNLAWLYEIQFKDINKAEKYYLMAIEKDHVGAMNNIALLYEREYKDYERAMKYYLMAIEKNNADAMFNIARLYFIKYKDYEKAENYLLRATEKDHIRAMNNLAFFYFEKKTNIEKAIDLANKAYNLDNDKYNSHTYATVLLWDNQIELSYKIAQDFLEDLNTIEKDSDDVIFYLLFLMAKKQYHLTLKIFDKNPHELKDRFKPVYYALMYFMQDEYPNEYRKMGDELKETVQEIIDKIKKLEIDYQ
jgi:TPR repeat protein